jgi:hypothetical protein
MLTWSKDDLRKIAQSDDLHIAPVPRQSKSAARSQCMMPQSAEGLSVAQLGGERAAGQGKSLFFKKRNCAGPCECAWYILVSRFRGFDRVTFKNSLPLGFQQSHRSL